jgi:YidC/Oxa1 family membrane protein insertase
MESGRFVIAIILMIATVVIVNILFPPVRRPARPIPADTAAVVAPAPAAASPSTAPATGAPQPSAPAANQPAQPPVQGPLAAARVDTILVESPLYRFGISTQGASLVSAELLKYESHTRSGPVDLAAGSGRGLLSHRVRTDDAVYDLATLPFQADKQSVQLKEGDQGGNLKLTYQDAANGRTIDVIYAFLPNDYLIDVTITVRGGARATQLLIDLQPGLAQHEANLKEDQRASAFVVNSRRDGVRSTPLFGLKETRTEEGPLSWIALKNKYFVMAALPPQGSDQSFGGLVAGAANRQPTGLTATLPIPSGGVALYRAYVGPQEYDRLIALHQQLEDVNPYGWRWLRPIIRPLGHAFTWILLETRRATGLDYGWVLILFGIAVRLALWPLNAKAMRSQMRSMELQPRVKDIQTRLKNNPELMQKEMLKLYREEGFNPMGGCLPLLLPFPVLLTLFFVFQSTIEFRGVSFLWLPDLSRADPLYILPVVLAVTMFIQQWLSMRSSPPNPQMKVMLWFMPAFMLVVFLNFASGLNLYYAAQNFASFPQQLQLIRERQRYQASRGTQAPVGKMSSSRA